MIFARASEALRAGERYFRLISFFDRLRDITRVKKCHIFLASLKKILKANENFFGQKFSGKMLKTLNKANFAEKLLKMVAMFAIRLVRRKQIALKTVCCIY